MNTSRNYPKRVFLTGPKTALACLLWVSIVITPVTFAGELELDDQTNAKLARIKSKMQVEKNLAEQTTDSEDENEDPESCGSVDIGSVVQDSVVNTPREINIVITGDIINAYNDCR